MTTEADFIQAVIASPDNDAPRLIFADWLDEHEQGERAQFIRIGCRLAREFGMPPPGSPVVTGDKGRDAVEVELRRRERELLSQHWRDWLPPPLTSLDTHVGNLHGPASTPLPVWVTFRRGFVAEVRTTLAAWVGGECSCWGVGTDGKPLPAFACPACHGKGAVPGLGPAVVRAQPVQVVTTEKRPYLLAGSTICAWNRLRPMYSFDVETSIPDEVFDLMANEFKPPRHGRANQLLFPAEVEANAALSTALILWAKGLPK